MSQLLLLNLIDYLYYFKSYQKYTHQIHLYNMKCAGHVIIFLFFQILFLTNTQLSRLAMPNTSYFLKHLTLRVSYFDARKGG